jgi:hypothetical protein
MSPDIYFAFVLLNGNPVASNSFIIDFSLVWKSGVSNVED